VSAAFDRIDLSPPDITPFRAGNTGIGHAISVTAPVPGPHVVISALMHGNELCGAIALERFLKGGLRPCRGRLSFVFCNVSAFQSFDLRCPAASRYVDEDMNRVWMAEALDGLRDSVELRRARQLRPLFDRADYVLDLHSMQNPTAPLMLCGTTARARDLARRVACPQWVVADGGHSAGRRLIDYHRFTDPDGRAVALLAECGQHWRAGSVDVAVESSLRFLLAVGSITPQDLARWLPGHRPPAPATVVEVTRAVTVEHDDFHYMDDYVGMEVIPQRGTLIAMDGPNEVRTPFDDCILIMPSRHLKRGQTAVRLGRVLP